jgi:adenosine deaminase
MNGSLERPMPDSQPVGSVAMEQTAIDPLRIALAAMPKIELHRHLEGALRLSTLAEIASKYQLDVPARDVEGLRHYVQVLPDAPNTAEHFLSRFATLRNFYCAPEVIQRIAYEAVEDAAADNITYMELRFTPKALARRMGFPLDEVAKWVCDAVKSAQEKFSIKVKLIIAMNRHESLEEATQMAHSAIALHEQGVVGIDLCGQENGYPAAPFANIILEAAKAGLGITIHGGEWAEADNIRYAIERLGATRIGHGVRVFDDFSVVELAHERGVVFEVCPTSNIHSGVVSRMIYHPIRRMIAHDLKITINTDDPSVSNITLTDELYTAAKVLAFSEPAIKGLLRNAAQAAFLPDAERTALVTQFS